MTLSFVELIILLAAAQGLFLAVLIFHKHGNIFANRFLGTLILFYSILLIHLLFGDLGYPELYYRLAPLVVGIAFFMIPLHYLYARDLVTNASGFNLRDSLHFIPFILWEVFWVFMLVLTEESEPLWRIAIGSEESAVRFVLFNWLIIIQAVMYLLGTVYVLDRYAREIKDVFSNLDQIKLDWLRYMTYLALALVGIFLMENALNLFGPTISAKFELSSLLVAGYVYAIGYLGIFKSEVFSQPEVAATLNQIPAIRDSRAPSEVRSSGDKYRKSGLSHEKAEEYRQRLEQLMDEKQPYTQSDLTLDNLADMLGISPHNLSEVINTRLNQNFFDYINGYRVEQVKADLTDPEKGNLTILAIAFDAGFNSKSSFYTIFKRETGMTPTDYQKQFS